MTSALCNVQTNLNIYHVPVAHIETTWLVRISAMSSLQSQVAKLVLDTWSSDLLRLIPTTLTAIILKCQNVVLTILMIVVSCQQAMEHYF